PTALGTLSADEWVGAQVAIVGLSPDARPDIVALDRVDRNVQLLRIRTTGSGIAAGGPTEQTTYMVATIRNGLITRAERFPLEYSEEAFRRFDELRRPVHASLDNAAVQTYRRLAAAITSDSWDAASVRLADDVVFEDRRTGLRI